MKNEFWVTRDKDNDQGEYATLWMVEPHLDRNGYFGIDGSGDWENLVYESIKILKLVGISNLRKGNKLRYKFVAEKTNDEPKKSNNIFWIAREKGENNYVRILLGTEIPDKKDYYSNGLGVCVKVARAVGIRLRKGQAAKFRITAERVDA